MKFSILNPTTKMIDFVDSNLHYLESSWMYTGGARGMEPRQVTEALVVELAIQSGEMPLPGDQGEYEDLPSGPLEIDHVLWHLTKYPEFTRIAKVWAYQQDPNLFWFYGPDFIDG